MVVQKDEMTVDLMVETKAVRLAVQRVLMTVELTVV